MSKIPFLNRITNSLNMARGKSSALFNVMQLSTANFATKFISIPVLAFYARYLSKDELSFIPVYLMIGSMSTLFFNFGILPTFVKLVPSKLKKNYEEAKSLIFTGFIINVFGILLFCFCTYIFSRSISILVFHTPSYSNLLRIMSIGFFFQGAFVVSNYLLWSTSRFNKISTLTITQVCIQAILTVSLYLIQGLKGLVVGLVLADLVSAIIAVYFLKDFLFQGLPKFYPLRGLISFPFYLESYLMYARSQGDQWIVATFLGPSSMAIYYIAKKIYDMLCTIHSSFDRIMTSSLSKVGDDKNILADKVSHLFPLMSCVIFPGIFLLIGLSPFLIDFIAGHAYKEAVVPAIILTLVILVTFFWGPIGRAIFILNPSVDRVKVTLVESILLISFLFLFTQWLNIIGVALARLLSSVMTGIYAYYVLKQSLQIKIPKREIIFTFISSMCMAIFLISGQLIYFNYLMIFIYLAFGIIIFLVLISNYISEQYYSTLNLILPFEIKDPVKLLLSKINNKTSLTI